MCSMTYKGYLVDFGRVRKSLGLSFGSLRINGYNISFRCPEKYTPVLGPEHRSDL
jgi:hypothetical protein